MATTNQLRIWFPELCPVWWTSPPKCDYSIAVPVLFDTPTGKVSLKVHPKAVGAFRALSAVFRAYGYQFRESSGGTLNCRSVTGGRYSSLHAHGIALDINPSVNRYVHQLGPIKWGVQTDMSPEMIKDIEAIRTVNGAKVFTWGGRWTNTKDPMHFEINCSPGDLDIGIDLLTVRYDIEEDDMDWVTILKAMPRDWWSDLQVRTGIPGGDWSYLADGRASDAEWQAQAPVILGAALQGGGLVVDGVARAEAGKANQALARIKSVLS